MSTAEPLDGGLPSPDERRAACDTEHSADHHRELLARVFGDRRRPRWRRSVVHAGAHV